MTEPSEHRLAAIMFTDIVGYTALMASSEARGHRVRARQREILKPLIESYGGTWIQHTGDEVLASFPSAVTAANCALAIQAALRDEPDLRLRIGLHVGDVIARDGGLHGDGVNITARIRPLAEPGGVCVSDEVVHAIRNQENLKTTLLGSHELKNVGRPVAVYALEGNAAAPSAGTRRVRARSLAFAAFGVALVAIAVAAYLTFGGSPPKGSPLTSIAVLPFDDMSPGGDQKWLADGMAEELIETLSRIETLRVPARTSAFALKGKDIRTVGAELRVGSVVEGSVRRSDDQLRITAQLIRVSDGYHLWSARYDRKLADVFAIQSEIARAIAEAIRGELGIEYENSFLRSHEPSDVRAYELVRKGLDAMWPSLTGEGIRKGIESYRQALAIDPDYAQAHAELGLAHLWLWSFHGRAESDLATASAEADRALAIDATNGSALHLLSQVLWRQYRWDEARAANDRGLAQNPGHGPLRFNSGLLSLYEGRISEAVAEMRRAVDLDPRQWFTHAFLGVALNCAREYAAAAEALERAWDLAPSARYVRGSLAYAYHRSGRDREALEAAVRAFPPDLAGLGAAMRQGFETGGFQGMVRAEVAWRVANQADACTNAFGEEGSGALGILGEADTMFECLQSGIGRRDPEILAHPIYDPYRGDPRFAAVLRRMNLAE